MNKILNVILAVFCWLSAEGQFKVEYNPAIQPQDMQYFKPVGNQFVGDCIPFFHNDTYYLYWLLDEGHHSALNGLGGHQWVVSTTKDLKHWTHHPIAIGIDEDWEKSICTGSVAYHKGKFYAFYATRLIDGTGAVNEQLSYAISTDGIHFVKQKPNPFYTSAPGYSKRSFRDPKVVIDPDGTFHLFVTSLANDYAMQDGRGVLVHLTSNDLKNWTVLKPLLAGQQHDPECPDYFLWNGWYYLIYGQGGDTYYVKSRQPYGPWVYPHSQAFVGEWENVAKTAAFTGGRRILAAWIPSRNENKDKGGERFGGNVVLREVVQLPDGDLGVKFPEETMPVPRGRVEPQWTMAENASMTNAGNIVMDAPGDIGGACAAKMPADCRITLTVVPDGNNQEYGLVLRADEKAGNGYRLRLSPDKKTAGLHNTAIGGVTGLDGTVQIDAVMKGDIIDVCINKQRCVVNRLIEQRGEYLWLYVRGGKIRVKDITVQRL